MNNDQLKNVLASPYESKAWKDLLSQLFSHVALYFFKMPQDQKKNINKHKDVAHIWEYGKVVLSDDTEVKLYEVELKENQQVTNNRVGLRNIITSEISYGDGAIITYYNSKAPDWRLSFISKHVYWAAGNEVKKETHPKRYTYLLGEDETVKTAVDQFQSLFDLKDTKSFALEDILKAFSVEKLSKDFYKGYFQQYNTFVKYIIEDQEAFACFLQSRDKAKARRLVSDFVKKILGRIVFLYFLQKKGWLGVPTDKAWGEGQKDFLYRLFNDFEDKDNFYQRALAPLFFDTLNKDRTQDNDIFKVTNTRIPYLNGGLFDQGDEPTDIQFDPKLFKDLFDFFGQYNFTIDESSPEDQDIGIDPEMLGHIFENLLEDNKDKGAFYTPKEIVHYMTQESLIEYLHTHLSDISKENLTIFVKQKVLGNLNQDQLDLINNSLDKVKILDPAIGSGAFPMGLLHEIFTLKSLIAFERGFKTWSPARVKERIIENSIYGVDIEEGAVDIARLRFWLSLVVDEPEPKPLPNLDYKIICGNSLISRYALDIPLDNVFRSYNRGKKDEDKMDLAKYKELVKEYMHESTHDKKEAFRQMIKEVKNSFQTTFDKRDQKKIADARGSLDNLKNSQSLFGKKASKTEIKKAEKKLAQLEQQQKHHQEGKLFDNAVEWRFEFPNLLDDDGNFMGFDIVIGNPPYLQEKDNAHIFEPVNKSPLGLKYHQGKMDYWYYFHHHSINITNDRGVISLITSRYWLNSDGAKLLINRIQKEVFIVTVVDIGKLKVFEKVAGHHMIHIYKKQGCDSNLRYNKLFNDIKSINSPFENENINMFVLNNEEVFFENNIVFNTDLKFNIDTIKLGSIYDVSQGVIERTDKISNKQKKLIGEDNFVGEGVFVLKENEVEALNLTNDEIAILQKYIDTNDLGKYYIKPKSKKYLIYSNKSIKQDIQDNIKYTNIKAHLDRMSNFIESSNKPYGIHRPRTIEYFNRPKIVFKVMFASPEFTYDDENYFFGMSFCSIIKKNNQGYSLKYLLAILNSKLAKKWFYTFGKLRGVGVDVGVKKLRTFPIAKTSYQPVFETIVDYILFIKKLDHPLNEYVPNSDISEIFEEVIDAMVFELYFPEDFQRVGIHFIQYAERDFESIEGKSQEEQATIIHDAYQMLRQKDNEIRNNIKAMKIDLRDLLMPILTA